MPKPKKDRFVLQPPAVAYFKPQGIPMFQLDQIVLSVDEYEALRLVDYEGLQQKQAAERMEVSRATCARILESAHRKVAEALTGGKAIRIEGGSYVLGSNRYRCRECNASWDVPLRGPGARPQPLTCPRCKGDKVMDLAKQLGKEPLGVQRGHQDRSGGGGPGRRSPTRLGR
jgi:predicted DNA-binding protein (UPF0251 family)